MGADGPSPLLAPHECYRVNRQCCMWSDGLPSSRSHTQRRAWRPSWQTKRGCNRSFMSRRRGRAALITLIQRARPYADHDGPRSRSLPKLHWSICLDMCVWERQTANLAVSRWTLLQKHPPFVIHCPGLNIAYRLQSYERQRPS